MSIEYDVKGEVADYEVRPGVVPCGKPAKVRILPRGGHARFDDKIHKLSVKEKFTPYRFRPEVLEPDRKAEYRIYFLPMEHSREPERLPAYDLVRVYPKEDGSLEFEYTFAEEQEYRLIILDAEEQEAARLSIYAVEEDLYGRRAYHGDLHVHSYFSDGREDPRIVAANYRKYGFDFFALTDHHKMFSSEILVEALKEFPMDLAVFTGEEVHVPYPLYIHAVNFGGKASVNQYYEDDPNRCEEEVAQIMEEIGEVEGLDREHLAWRIWVARQIHRIGGMSILVHPHWINRDTYHMPDAETEYLIAHGVYDCLEVVGGHCVHSNNMQTSFYYEQRARGWDIPVVGSSDSHGTEPANYFKYNSTLVFSQGKTLEELTGPSRTITVWRWRVLPENLTGCMDITGW